MQCPSESRCGLIRRLALPALCCLAALLLIGGCGTDDRPSLILVVMDTTCHDRLGCTGHVAAETATLDSLAAAGVRCSGAITAAPVTGPSIASILSGVTPAVHGLRDNGKFTLGDDLELLAEVFNREGYRTGGVVGAVPLLGRFGFERGFDSYDDRFAEDPYRVFSSDLKGQEADLGQSERRADAVTTRALRWLETVGADRPVFLLVHYYDPHTPPDPPPAYLRRHAADPYDGEVAFMDAQIGRLLAGARRLAGERGLRVAAVGDHGEAFFVHDEPTHGFFVYDTTVRVPLILSGPGLPAGRVVGATVRTIDLAPTLAGWCGLPPPARAEGLDLSAALAGGRIPAACDTAYVETFMTQLTHGWAPLQGVRTPGWKWIKAPRCELYDLGADPAETVNRATQRVGPRRTLATWLDDYLVRAGRLERLYGARPADVDPDLARRLASLGYVGGADGGSVRPDYDRPGPKDAMADKNHLMIWYQYRLDAGDLLRDGRSADALGLLDRSEQLLPLPDMVVGEARNLLGQYGYPDLRASSRVEPDLHRRGRLQVHLIRSLVLAGRIRPAAALADSLADLPGTSVPQAAALRAAAVR